jgi:hypothetical protein
MIPAVAMIRSVAMIAATGGGVSGDLAMPAFLKVLRSVFTTVKGHRDE